MRIYWINNALIGIGKIGMMPRPKGGLWLEDEIQKLYSYEATVIVSLLEKEEIEELDLTNEAILCKQKELTYFNFPIKDVSVPESRLEFVAFVDQLIRILKKGKNIVIHCRMGIGRTSMLTAGILIALKIKESDTVFEYLSEIRTLNVPDTSEQIDWVLSEKTLNLLKNLPTSRKI